MVVRERGYRDRQGGVASSIAPTPSSLVRSMRPASAFRFRQDRRGGFDNLKRKATPDVGHSSRKELVNYQETTTKHRFEHHEGFNPSWQVLTTPSWMMALGL